MKVEEWNPSRQGEQISGYFGRQGGDALIQTDEGLLLLLPRAAMEQIRAIDPDIGERVTVRYEGLDAYDGRPDYVAWRGPMGDMPSEGRIPGTPSGLR